MKLLRYLLLFLLVFSCFTFIDVYAHEDNCSSITIKCILDEDEISSDSFDINNLSSFQGCSDDNSIKWYFDLNKNNLYDNVIENLISNVDMTSCDVSLYGFEDDPCPQGIQNAIVVEFYDGNTKIDTQNVDSLNSVELSSPKKDGYEFKGWFDKDDNEIKKNNISSLQPVTVSEDECINTSTYKLYTKWEELENITPGDTAMFVSKILYIVAFLVLVGGLIIVFFVLDKPKENNVE